MRLFFELKSITVIPGYESDIYKKFSSFFEEKFPLKNYMFWSSLFFVFFQFIREIVMFEWSTLLHQ